MPRPSPIALAENRPTIAFLAILLILVGASSLAIRLFRVPLEPLTRENLESARKCWAAAGIDSYDFSYLMTGMRYDVRVRQGRVEQLTCDSRETTSHSPDDFSITGLFDILALELDALDDPDNPLGGEANTTILRVRFNRNLGYVEHYIRLLGGTGRSQTIESLNLTVTQR